jgi:hypothetical protein
MSQNLMGLHGLLQRDRFTFYIYTISTCPVHPVLHDLVAIIIIIVIIIFNSVAIVGKRTIPTERPPHVGEVISANFC